jgi:hypothetical protein
MAFVAGTLQFVSAKLSFMREIAVGDDGTRITAELSRYRRGVAPQSFRDLSNPEPRLLQNGNSFSIF